MGSASNITISGGSVTASGGTSDAEAIGSGGNTGSSASSVTITGGEFADTNWNGTKDGKIYGITPASDCIAYKNDETGYPVAVGKKPALTFKDASALTSLVYDMSALEGSDILASAPYEGVEDSYKYVTFKYQPKDTETPSSWQSGLPIDVGTYRVSAALAANVVGGVWYAPADEITATVTIVKCPIVVVGATVEGKTYDGTTAATLTNVKSPPRRPPAASTQSTSSSMRRTTPLLPSSRARARRRM